MFNYTNIKCEICNEAFTNDSDVVVCPDCGTPYHRHCYKDKGECLHKAEHKKGYEWENPNNKKNDDSPSVKIDIVCPSCGYINTSEATSCASCEREFTELSDDIKENITNSLNPETMANNNIPTVSTPFPKSPLDFIQQLNNDLSSEIDGVLVKDIAIYLGPNSYEYIRKFKRMQEDKKYRPFSLVAFLFGWPFFFYRKLWNLGLISFIVSMASSYFLRDTLINPELVQTNPIYQYIALGAIAFSVILGFVAYPAIKSKTINDLKEYKNSTKSKDEYYRIISQKAGPSKLVLFIGLLFWIFSIFG